MNKRYGHPRLGYGDGWEGPLPFGALHDVQVSTDDDDERPVAALYLPNPQMPRGWETYHVWREKPKAEKRRVGFGR